MNGGLVNGESKRKISVQAERIGKVVVYEVTKRELRDIEKGEHNTFLTGLSSFFISAGISFLTTYLTLDNTDTKKGGIILVVFIASFIIGIASLIGALYSKRELKSLFNEIRNRE